MEKPLTKRERQLAVLAEMERRATASGIPPTLHVYLVKHHFSDEKGPRSFVPVLVSEDLKRKVRDRNLWPSLCKEALEDRRPIEMRLDDSQMYRNGRTPPADFYSWGNGADEVFILTERAHRVLLPLIERISKPVPLTCDTHRLFGFHLTAAEDVIDFDHSDCYWLGPRERNRVMSFKKHAFITEKLGNSPLFRIPQLASGLYALQPFVDLVMEHHLTGQTFQRLWPESPVDMKLIVPVKKLPPTAGERKMPQPVLSISADETVPGPLLTLVGTITESGHSQFQILAYKLPDLSLPSGRIIAADLLLGEAEPFTRTVQPGKYPFALLAARLNNTDERIAFAILLFSDNPIAKWEPATSLNTQDNCYPVDSGCGGFCDACAQEAIQSLGDPEQTQMKRIEKAMTKSYKPTRSWCHIHTQSGDAAVFSSGFGDGSYASYFALDHTGNPVALLTDFGILDWSNCPDQTIHDPV